MTKTKKQDNIIRVGDKVKIITPEMFVRCGYPLTFQDAKKIVEEKYYNDVNEFLSKLGWRTVFKTNVLGFETFMKTEMDYKDSTEDRILNALTYEYVRREGFGGEERKIYTKYDEYYEGMVFTVAGKKYHKTGTYVGGGGGFQDYWTGEWDYDPSYLKNEKTHTILKLGFSSMDNKVYYHSNDLMIEKIHVEKIVDAEE